jgi:UDP-MurNAc hydroxylase
MQLTYLGHAGFFVETADSIVVMDPWLSADGAFDSSWFQLPRNHQLAPLVHEKLRNSAKQRFVYISHEHHDHFDPAFLSSLPNKDLTYVLPNFQRAALRSAVSQYHPKALITCDHGQEIPIPGGYLKLYLQDSGLSRDSGVLVKTNGQSFLNLNDCKLYDELTSVVEDQGPISVFACQFSGATWHPICYDYEQGEYERISQHKIMTKFEMIARAIETTKARVYLPSAGPACFLDPTLMHLNFERVNIFPRAPKFLEYLGNRLANSPTQALNVMPGDVLDVESAQLISLGGERVDEENIEAYLHSYAAEYRDFFVERQPKYSDRELAEILERLRIELNRKLSAFVLHDRVRVPLYFGLSDSSSAMLRVDFPRCVAELVSGISEADFYSLMAPSWQVARILNGEITWEDFALTFRVRLNRKPDVYQTLIQGFLLMEPEDMNWFCARLIEIEDKQNRIVVEAGGTRYSIDRYCPHQGADLSQGWLDEGNLWTCPRHRWHFAFDKGGRCLTSNASIHSVCLEND